MKYVQTISPVTIQSFSQTKGRGDELLFFQGGFFQESWKNCIFTSCRFEDVNFCENELINNCFIETIFHKVNLSCSKLTGVNLMNCKLELVDFHKSYFNVLNLQNCFINHCNFIDINGQSISFTNSVLHNCKFQGSNLSNSNLSSAKELFGCEYDQFTQLPFSQEEAIKRGMIYVPRLELVSDLVTVKDNIIDFPQIRPSAPINQEHSGELIDFFNYLSLKNIDPDEGPQSA